METLLPWAQSCLSQLLGPDAVQDVHQGIQQFQTQQQLPATGVLDQATVTALQAACSGAGAQAGGPPSAPPTPEIGESEFEFDGGDPERVGHTSGQSGRWVRHKNKIILFDV